MPLPRKRFCLALAVLLCAVKAGPCMALDNVRIATASMTSSSVLYLQIAQREGYFKAHGINVEIINMRGEIAAKIAAAGEIDFFTQGLSGLTAAMRGLPLKILMVVDQKPAWDFLAQPQIKSFAQLKGGIVGILSFEGSVAQATREMLRKNNLDPGKDIQLMVMGGNDMRFVALKGKAIQATLLDAANSYRARSEGFHVLASAGDYVSYYLNGGMVASQSRINETPDKISRFITAAYKGYQFFLTRRDASIHHMMDLLKAKDRGAVAAVYDSSLKTMSRDGSADPKQLEGIIAETKRSTALKRDVRVSDYFDFSFLRQAAEQLKAADWKP